MKRFTETLKWDDPWFRSLAGVHKLVFLFVIDRCDNAGFWEVDEEAAAFHTKLDIKHIQGAWKALERGLKGADGWVWVRSFLKHQKNEILNAANPAHRQIISLLRDQEKRFSAFPEFMEFLSIARGLEAPVMGHQSPIGTGKGKGKGLEEEGKRVKGKGKPDMVETDDPLAIRISAIFGRRQGNLWDAEQLKAFQAFRVDEQDIADLEGYYRAERAKGKDSIHRRDMTTFLNNFMGELDRARAWRQQKGGSSIRAPVPEPPGWRDWVHENYPDATTKDWDSLLESVKQEFAGATPELKWRGLRWGG